MKKSLIVLALATVLVLAFAASAYAWTPSPTYIAWDASGVNVNGPHADYQTGTTKCSVCHAVHYAPIAGATGTVPSAWTATAPTQLLLRSSAAESCAFCHIDTAVGGVQLYGGAAGVYDTSWGVGHTGKNSTACVNCHAVHGANTFKGDNESKILRVSVNDHGAAGVAQPEAVAAADGIFDSLADAASDNAGLKYERQMVFCGECHDSMFSRSADTTLTTNFKTHSIVSASAADFTATTGGTWTKYNADGTVAATGVTTNTGVSLTAGSNVNVAPSGVSSSCRACHTAGGVDQPAGISWNSFPHYTRGLPYFLAGTFATPTDVTGNTGEAMDTALDANCISCHSNTGSDY